MSDILRSVTNSMTEVHMYYDGRKIHAIKRFREIFELPLLDAKRIVDRWVEGKNNIYVGHVVNIPALIRLREEGFVKGVLNV